MLAASCCVVSLFQIKKLAGKIWVYGPATHGSHKIKELGQRNYPKLPVLS
jgi:hypothetical protein